VSEFASAAEGHRRELLLHCYRMLGSLPDAEDAVQETLLRAWRYRDSLKEGAPLRPWLYRVATNACLDAIARDERRALLAAKAEGDNGAAGRLEDVVWLGPIPDAVLGDSVLEPPTPPTSTPEAIALSRETIEIGFLTVIQLLTPQQRAALILCDVLDWSAKEAADLLDISVAALNSALQRARTRLRERLPSRKPVWPASVDASAAERDLLKKLVEASEAADIHAFESIIRADATFRMPPQPDTAAGRDAMLALWVAAGFGSERFGRLRCVLTRANRQPAVANYVRRPGDSAWRALALDVLHIEDGLIAEIVTFSPDCFPLFGLPLLMDASPEINTCH
jgi:RNA polymerase sigma-70 factor (ECF subfamily)